MAGAKPLGTVAQSQRAWKMTKGCGELAWLENSAFISADCFQSPPSSNTRPRAWDRIAVPTTTERRSDQMIYKRVVAKPRVDSKYRAVVTELESQGLEERKRARIQAYVEPYGSAEFGDKVSPEITGVQELAVARGQVQSALENIWRDNLRLRDESCRRKNKRPSFDPAQVTWVPRKRHNTRWPINPPGEDAAFIAKLQPLIKFELHPNQIDEAVCFEQDMGNQRNGVEEINVHQPGAQQNWVPQSPRVPEPEEPTQQLTREKPSRRRRTLRPSLSTISEVIDEVPVFSIQTPASSRRVNTSLAKRWQAAADTSKTPTKVAESPMKEFTLDATPNAGDMIVTNQNGVSAVPSLPTNTDSTPGRAPEPDQAVHFCGPSELYPENTAAHAPIVDHEDDHQALSTELSDSIPIVTGHSSTYITALPFFDQPIPDVQTEPEHESRRRLSLDKARRSDRTSNVRIIKRVHHWMAGAFAGKKRRHSDVGALREHKLSKRRHTLDVDAALNPDIFGQVKICPTPSEPLRKEVEALHKPAEPLQQHVANVPAASLEGAPIRVEKPLAQDEALALSETEDNVEGDSDMAYLQSFVQRSKSSKEEKRDDVPSAPILLKGYSRKRRSGSMNSATSDAGSPMSKMAATATKPNTTSLRVPLGEKDANKSPSPSKKRKLKGAEDGSAPIKKKSGRLVAPDLDDLEPATTKRKKRRKGMESDTDDIFNPDMDLNQVLTQRSAAGGAGAGAGPGARRSSRIATTHKTEPSPINVRLPGGVFIDNGDMPVVSTAGITNAVLQRKVDKDLATETRANTRRNRGGAVPVQMALASMAERLTASGGDETNNTTIVSTEHTVSRLGSVKTVRWDETLARVQGEEEAVATAAAVESVGEKVELDSLSEPDQEEEEDDTKLPSPPQLRVVDLPRAGPTRPGNPVANQLVTDSDEQEELIAKKSGPVRRSSRAATVSRLPKRGGGVTPAAAPPAHTPKRSSLPAPSRLSKAGGRGGAAAAGAAEARARLGMAGPGTPAPRRGGRRGGRRG